MAWASGFGACVGGPVAVDVLTWGGRSGDLELLEGCAWRFRRLPEKG